MDINWYPGHMKKAKETIEKNLPLIDIIYEVIDSRIPYSSQNPELKKIFNDKIILTIMNKSDLSDTEGNRRWFNYFEERGNKAVLINCISRKGINDIIDLTYRLTREQRKDLMKKGIRNRPIRAMVVGVPNVGKSILINCLTKSKGVKVGNRPGITKENQWIRIRKDLELLDTPGILWPKLGDRKIGLNLAFTGAVKDELLDVENLAVELIKKLNSISEKLIEKRYKITIENKTPYELLLEIGKKRGCIIKGGEIDTVKASRLILDEFRKGIIGRVTLEMPN